METKVSPTLAAALKSGFIHHCVEAIRIGYEKMVLDKRYALDWDEDNITACLVETMKQTGYLRKHRISVNLQTPIVNTAIAFEGANFLEAPKVDFKLSTWANSVEDEIEFFAEAKNLSERDWIKSGGAHVQAAYYRRRYIDTGIENYLTDRYPEGCLVGYVVNGTISSVVAGLNRLIQSRNLSPRVGQLIAKDPPGWTAHYYSENSPHEDILTLIHLILQLS